MSGKVVVAGYLLPLVKTIEEMYPDFDVVVVEDADVVERSRFGPALRASTARELITWPYPLAHAADAFHHRYRDLDVRAVLPGVEYAVPFAARLAERYGVPGATLGAANLLRDKALLRAVSREAGVANPAVAEVDDLEAVRGFLREHPGPVVLKPANRQASVGVRIVRDPDDVESAWTQALSQEEARYVAYDGLPLRMLVEEFVAGPEFSVEMLLDAGRPLFANVTGKLLHPGDRPIELGHVVPADIPAALAEELVSATECLMDVIGFGSGLTHCEWIVRDGVPYLVECAGRMPGDGIVDLIERAWPIDLVRRYVTVMLGGTRDPAPRVPLGGAAVLYPAVPPGVIESIDGLDEARAVPGVHQSVCVLAVGDRVNELRSSWDRVVGAAATGPTTADALAAAWSAVARIAIKTIPDA